MSPLTVKDELLLPGFTFLRTINFPETQFQKNCPVILFLPRTYQTAYRNTSLSPILGIPKIT